MPILCHTFFFIRTSLLDLFYIARHLIWFCRCIDVAGAYSTQKTELNISLTAIGLLWTATDFIVKGLVRWTQEEFETGSVYFRTLAILFVVYCSIHAR